MPTIDAEGIKSFETEKGKKLVLAIEDAGIDILHRCGGNARCTTCRVEVIDGEAGTMGPLEQERLSREIGLAANIRLSCQVHVDGDLKIKVVNRVSERGMDAGPRPVD